MRLKWELFLIPPLIASLGLLIASQFTFIRLSFFEDLGYGTVSDSFSLQNYLLILSNSVYVESLLTTVKLSLIAVLVCIAVGFPSSYALARMRAPWGTLILSLILCASFVTIVVKVLGLVIIFGSAGPINSLLLFLGIIDRPLRILGSEAGVVIGLVQYTIGFFIIMMFSVFRTIPRSLEEAAQIHGASRWRVMTRVIIPISMPGLMGASLIAFSLSMGAFASPALLGGGRVLTLPVLIQQTLLVEARYGVAAALSAILLLAVLLINLFSTVLVSRTNPLMGKRP